MFYFLSIVGAATIAATHFLLTGPTLSEKKVFISPPPQIEYFSFGQQFVLADSLWIRAIQDIDFCENQIKKNQCKGNSWLFQMLDSATNLAPDYLIIYNEGGIALSVLLSDIAGAAHIYQKGLALFPLDFDLHYRAAVHAYVEEKNSAKAADLFLKAAKIQGLKGDWIYSLATRLYTEAGKKEIAEQIYRDMKSQGLDEAILKRMREKLGIDDE